jgi:hypothetical protein
MAIRVKLFGVEKPVIRTIHRNILLNARELNHLLSKEELQKIFPNGAGINFDFSQRNQIILCPENNIVSHLNHEPMVAGQEYPLVLGDTKILGINNFLFRAHVVHSFF